MPINKETLDQMKLHGTAFESTLAQLYELGNEEQRILIERTFQDVFEKYEQPRQYYVARIYRVINNELVEYNFSGDD